MTIDPSTVTTGEDANTTTAANAAGFFGASLETAIERAKYAMTYGPNSLDRRGKAEQLTPTAPRLHFKR